jgi:hypothetical protein
MVIILLWILVTLAMATGSMILGKIYGKGLLIGIYTALIVMAQVFANKLVVFGGYVVPAAVIVYGVSFLITDALCEFYSKKDAKIAIASGFIGSVLLVLGVHIVIAWEYPIFWEGQEAIKTTLGMTGRIVLGSLVAYIFSQNWDVFVFHKIKEVTKGKHLWLRNNASTMSSQLIDTVLFISIAFYGTMPNNVLFGMIVGQYIVKLIIALFDTPFLYMMKIYYKEN